MEQSLWKLIKIPQKVIRADIVPVNGGGAIEQGIFDSVLNFYLNMASIWTSVFCQAFLKVSCPENSTQSHRPCAGICVLPLQPNAIPGRIPIRFHKWCDLQVWWSKEFTFLKGQKPFLQNWNRLRIVSQLGNDPDMCEKLIPKYELGCKRILFSLGEFLPLFVDRRRKVRPMLVTDDIAEVTEDGITTKKGEHIPADLIGKQEICDVRFRVWSLSPVAQS